MNTQHTITGAILPRLEGVIDRGNGRWYARCPAHDDRSPSLSIRVGTEGRILLFCFAGCPTEDVLAAMGLKWGDLYPDRWEAAYRAATARGVAKLPDPDPLSVERNVLRIAAADLRAGKTLTTEDKARVEVARQRLLQSRGTRHD